MTSRGEPHRARAVETAAGLGRRKPSGPERLLLDRPGPCSPSRQMSRSLFACAASAPHPVACCERASPRQGPASHLRLSSRGCPRVASRTAPNQKDASHQLLQPTPKTSTLWNVRFPSAPESIAAFRVQSPPRPMTSGSSRVEPRLTAMLQLRRNSDTPEEAYRAEALTAAQVRTLRRPGGASIGAPPRWVSR